MNCQTEFVVIEKSDGGINMMRTAAKLTPIEDGFNDDGLYGARFSSRIAARRWWSLPISGGKLSRGEERKLVEKEVFIGFFPIFSPTISDRMDHHGDFMSQLRELRMETFLGLFRSYRDLLVHVSAGPWKELFFLPKSFFKINYICKIYYYLFNLFYYYCY